MALQRRRPNSRQDVEYDPMDRLPGASLNEGGGPLASPVRPPEPDLQPFGPIEGPGGSATTGTGPGEPGGPGQNAPGGNMPPGAAGAAPARPRTPTPQAGASFISGPMPFDPLPSTGSDMLARPQRRGLYGSAGGLKGGGLGVPLDPTANQQSDPISGLIELLLKRRG